MIKGVYNIGNILVANPENLRLELSKLPLMTKPGNLQQFTDELIDYDFIDLKYFHGKKLYGK